MPRRWYHSQEKANIGVERNYHSFRGSFLGGSAPFLNLLYLFSSIFVSLSFFSLRAGIVLVKVIIPDGGISSLASQLPDNSPSGQRIFIPCRKVKPLPAATVPVAPPLSRRGLRSMHPGQKAPGCEGQRRFAYHALRRCGGSLLISTSGAVTRSSPCRRG